MEPVQEVAEDQGDAEAADPVDSKWSLKQLREEYARLGIDYVEVFGRIKDVCIKTLMSVEPYIISQMRTTKNRHNCYEVYGFDVLVDANLKPWLLEASAGAEGALKQDALSLPPFFHRGNRPSVGVRRASLSSSFRALPVQGRVPAAV